MIIQVGTMETTGTFRFQIHSILMQLPIPCIQSQALSPTHRPTMKGLRVTLASLTETTDRTTVSSLHRVELEWQRMLKPRAIVESEVAARSPQYETLASGVPAPSLRELGGLTSESRGSGGIGANGRVMEVTERFGVGLEVAEGFGGYGRGVEFTEMGAEFTEA